MRSSRVRPLATSGVAFLHVFLSLVSRLTILVSPCIVFSVFTLECLINVPVRVFISRKMPPYTGLIWHYTFIKKKKKKKFFFFFFFTFKCISLHILATQFLRNITNSPDLVVNKSGYLYNLSLGRLLEGDPLKCCLYHKQQALAQIALQATFHTICEICHPILLFGTILLLNLCDLPPYTLIWHYMFIRHTRVAILLLVSFALSFHSSLKHHTILHSPSCPTTYPKYFNAACPTQIIASILV